MAAKARSGISSTPCGGPCVAGFTRWSLLGALAAAKQFTPRSVEVAAFASLRKNFLRVATTMQEAGMQHGSLIRSGRKRGPNVWQFRWAGRRPYEKRVYRKRVIGTVCQYPDQDAARQSVTVLLREINRHALQRIGTTLLE